MRLIDADELRTYIDGYIERRKLSEHDRIVFEGFKGIIDNAQTVEIPAARWDCYCEGQKVGYEQALSERPQGEWIYNSYGNGCGNWHCSECGVIIFMGKNANKNFCPNCGADMKGGAEE